MADYGLHGEGKKVFAFLSAINQTAYKNLYLLSNEVLSKNPYTNNFFSRYLKKDPAGQPDVFTVISRLLLYYLKSFIYFGIYLSFFAAFRLSGLRCTVNTVSKELILIDTFFLVDKIEREKKHSDPYFCGLKEVLDKLNKPYAYLPVFYTTKNPVRLFKIFRILKKSKTPVLTEYQLLSMSDLLKIFYFILAYPITVLLFVKRLSGKDYETQLLKSELLDNLASITLLKFSRYLQGRKISVLACDKIKMISWFENQTIDKNLYKGIREDSNKARICGAQPFIGAKVILNLLVDEKEETFGILPHKIIVNGPYFVPENKQLEFVAGPSFRYEKLFRFNFKEGKRNSLLVLLSYLEEDTKNILKLLSRISLSSYTIKIKPHPAAPLEKFRSSFPANALLVSEDIYELFKTTKIVIGAASGSLLEAASSGIPVISVRNTQRFDYNSLPPYGKGIIWDEAENAEGLKDMIAGFEEALNNEDESLKIKQLAQEYKQMFFCEPTEENIIKAYDL